MRFMPVSGTAVWFSVWETRVQDFEAFVQATGHDTGDALYRYFPASNAWALCAGYHWRDPGFAQQPDCPVVGVNWEDAQAFCRWLTERERSLGWLRPGQRYRLPTDREWSCAVGLADEPGETPQQRFVQVRSIYPWGTNTPPPGAVGNLHPSFEVDSFERTAPVGSFRPDHHGLCDVVGNVMEWCEDWWNEEQRYRILRGSGWHTDCLSCLLSSYRYPNFPDLRVDYYGFRVVVEPAPER